MLQSLSPGLVETEFIPEEYLKMSPALNPEDIAAGVLYVLGAPPHVQVRTVCDVMLYSDFPKVVSCNSMEQSFTREADIC
jgi:NADP-dependent 3-hydroxy acid dehydrogenase YdfG